jgi:predicted negative regulator of RcsB-dependent stress response
VDEYMSEKEQWEWLKSWLRDNSLWILGGIGIGALIVSGWFWWGQRTDRLALEAGAKYTQITDSLAKGDKARGLALTAELERDYGSSPYVDQARLLSARVAIDDGQLDKAVDILKSTMEKTKDGELALVARMRLARVQLAQNKPDEALATLAAVDPGAFKARFDEVRGDVLYAKGDKPGALAAYNAARQGVASQTSDTQLLDLKIDDLVADNIKPTAPAATVSARPEAK